MSFLHQTGSDKTALPGEHICTDNATGKKDPEGNPFCRNKDGRERVDLHAGTTHREAMGYGGILGQ